MNRTIDQTLRTAIAQKRLVELIYKEKIRIVEPHDYGIHNGTVKLLGYQIGGSSSGGLPNWRWMEIDAMSEVHLLERKFRGGRPSPSGQHHRWDVLFARVQAPET